MAARGFSVHVGVGVRTLAAPRLGDAPGCDAAAEAMYELARSKQFTATPPFLNEKAKYECVKKALRDVFVQLKDGDLLFLSLAGHGKEKGDRGSQGEKRNQYFCLFDQWWKDDDINALLGEITAAARVVVVVEACESGSILTHFARVLTRVRLKARQWLAIDWFLDFFRHGSKKCEEQMPSMKAGPKLKANILLLAAAPVGKDARHKWKNHTVPPFTEGVLGAASIANNYLALRNLTCEHATKWGNPEPVLNVDLVTDLAFLNEKPFKIKI